MPIKVSVGKYEYESTNKNHAEEVMFSVPRHQSGDLTVSMNGWPCTGERHHNCHDLFIKQSAGRTITVVVDNDHAGYSANHGRKVNPTGTIVYNRGTVQYN